MNPRLIRRVAFAATLGFLGVSLTLSADPPAAVAPKAGRSATGPPPKAADGRVSVTEARGRATLMHSVYASTLVVMHRHYFRREGAVLPARALEDVFAELEGESKIRARWIAVNTPAMSINHKAETPFELKAAEEIAAGNASYDRVEDGYYKRAGAIPLGAGCVGCHTKVFQAAAKTPRFAGLVISIPVNEK